MKIKFYPYDFEYKFRNHQPYLYLYSKTENGEKIAVIHTYQPYFYASLNNIDKQKFTQQLTNFTIDNNYNNKYNPKNENNYYNNTEPAKITSFEEVEKELLGKTQSFLKIYVNYPKAVPIIAKELESWSIPCYEKDILFVHRYLRDLKLTPMTLWEAEGELHNDIQLRTPLFLAKNIQQISKETAPFWKLLAIDIETYAEKKEINFQKNPILMISFYGLNEDKTEFRKVITWKKFSHTLDYLETVSDEISVLQRFKEIILDYTPDIITGYFSDGFDFPYIKARADKYNLTLDLGIDFSEINAGKFNSSRECESKITGILHLDIFKFIRNIFGKDLDTDNLSLDAVASELLGHNKHIVNLDLLADTWDNHPEKLSEFCAYNLHDSFLAFQLCNKLLYDMIEFTKTIGLPTYDLIRMRFSRLVESYILKRALEFNVIAPNRPDDKEIEERMKESIQGAFVYEPTPGLYRDIVVFDFRSLYPTIISSHNIGPESFQCSCCRSLSHVPEKEDYWFCQKEKKFIPTILEDIITIRSDQKRLMKEAKKRGEDITMLAARTYALKVLANSFYGYLGFYGARWYCIECAASTTAYARNYIKQTISQAEKKGFKVIYADTDSCFLLLENKILDQALEFMNEVNFILPGQMELEFENNYTQGIFVAIKGTEKGAKKKYALMAQDGKMKIVGFETVRRNWSKLAKEVQENVLRYVLRERTEEALHYVKTIIKDLNVGKIPLDQLIIKTQITRELSQYTSIGPHIHVARKLAERGEQIPPGTIIEYIIVKGSGLIRDRAKIISEVKEGEYDAEYYINNQLIPAVNSIFAVLGYSEEDIFKKSSQKGLGSFF